MSRRRDGDRDGQKVSNGWWTKPLILAVDGPDAEGTQGAICQAFFDKLIEMLGPEAAKMPRKLAEAKALEFHAASYLMVTGWPKSPSKVPWDPKTAKRSP